MEVDLESAVFQRLCSWNISLALSSSSILRELDAELGWKWAYLRRLVVLAHFPDLLVRPLSKYNITRDHAVLLFYNLTFRDCLHICLWVADLVLKTGPALRCVEDGGGVWWVDGCGVGKVKVDHLERLA